MLSPNVMRWVECGSLELLYDGEGKELLKVAGDTPPSSPGGLPEEEDVVVAKLPLEGDQEPAVAIE